MGNGVSILFSRSQISILNELVRDNQPLEACAILLGKHENNAFVIKEIVPAQNRDSSVVRFTIDDDMLFEIYRIADKKNLSVVGIFHSHPSEPYPSSTDKSYMKVNPVPWVIKSTTTEEMRCFISSNQVNDNESQIEEIEIKIRD